MILLYSYWVPCRTKSELWKAPKSRLTLYDVVPAGSQSIGHIYVPRTCSKAGVEIFKPIPNLPEFVEYFKNIPADSEYIFYRNVNGKYDYIRNLVPDYLALRKECDLPWLRIHDLRHIAITNLYNNGTNAYTIAAIAGWKGINMLKNYYDVDREKLPKGASFGLNTAPLQKEKENNVAAV